MLAEILTWCLTPASLDARRTGHLTAAVSLWSRSVRCRRDWSAHEAHCHAIVTAAVEGCERRRTCLVLGSGLVRDVPLALLAERFETVMLVDVVHLWPARLKARRHANVALVALDVTGATDLLLDRATGLADPLARFAADPAIDLVISANCLSQLALQPVDRLERMSSARRRRHVGLGRRIVEGHLAALARFSGRVCLLTDSHGLDVDAEGRVVETRDLLEGVALPAADADWDWCLAPLGEWADDHAIVHRAHGFVDFHAAQARGRGGRSREGGAVACGTPSVEKRIDPSAP
ncbi:MAG: hypothetical protein GX458_18205 [Phyllobacteriaceae bacterium]|nr:hypothetical protein [Phyllobacteriaceae bacterium]